MRAWTAGVVVVLGTLLVLAGFAALVIRALWPSTAGSNVGVAPTPGTTWRGADGRLVRAARAMTEAERLIFWGFLLLLLGAVAAGIVVLNVSANTGH
jgi:hypothetical protein